MSNLTPEQMKKHVEVMQDFLRFLNLKTNNYVLKGGTALLFGYKLDRFSEDLDFDSVDPRTFKDVLDKYCRLRGYSYTTKKDTETVKRYMLQYDATVPALKMEISFRSKEIPLGWTTYIDGMKVYTIDALAQKKALAYNGRDRIRDLYDVSFIVNKYWNQLSESAQEIITDALNTKGFNQFEYLLDQEPDDLVNNDKLLDMFLNATQTAGLLTPNQQKVVDTDKDFVLPPRRIKPATPTQSSTNNDIVEQIDPVSKPTPVKNENDKKFSHDSTDPRR